MKNWKTTAAGILSALIGTSGPVTAFLGALQAARPAPDYTLTIIGAVLTLVFGIARVWVGLLQNDAPPNPTVASVMVIGSNIRSYAKSSPQKLGAWALVAVLLQGSLIVGGTATAVTLTGCPLTATQTENMVNTIVQQVGAILAVADPALSWTSDLSKSMALLKAAEASWVKGGAAQDVVNVLNDILMVTAEIAQDVPYASLVALLVAGAEQVVSLLIPSGPTGVIVANAVRAQTNPWHGRASVKSAADSKSQWQLIVKQNPALAKAKLS